MPCALKYPFFGLWMSFHSARKRSVYGLPVATSYAVNGRTEGPLPSAALGVVAGRSTHAMDAARHAPAHKMKEGRLQDSMRSPHNSLNECNVVDPEVERG